MLRKTNWYKKNENRKDGNDAGIYLMEELKDWVLNKWKENRKEDGEVKTHVEDGLVCVCWTVVNKDKLWAWRTTHRTDKTIV